MYAIGYADGKIDIIEKSKKERCNHCNKIKICFRPYWSTNNGRLKKCINPTDPCCKKCLTKQYSYYKYKFTNDKDKINAILVVESL